MLGLRWPQLLRGTLDVSSAKIISPGLFLRYDEAGWNVPRRAVSQKGPQPALLKPLAIKVVGGSCRLLFENRVETRVDGLTADLRPDGQGGYLFSASGSLGDESAVEPFTLAGKAGAAGVHARLNMDRLPLTAALVFLSGVPLSFGVESSGPVTAELDAGSGGARLRARTRLRGLSVEKRGYRLEGDAAVYSQTVVSASGGVTHATRFSLEGATLLSPGLFPELDGIAGDVVLSTEGLRAAGLHMTAYGHPLTLTGRMEGFGDPVFDFSAESGRIDLGRLPKEAAAAHGWLRLGGQSRLSLSVHGTADSLLSSVAGKLEFRDGTLGSAAFPRAVGALKGRVDFTADTARWRGVTFLYAGKTCRTTGSVKGWDNASISAAVSSGKSSLDLRARLERGLIRILRLRGSGPSLKLDLSGTIVRGLPGGPRFHARGIASALIEDVAALLPPQAARPVKKAGLKGRLSLEGELGGALNGPRDWRGALRARAEAFEARGFRLDEAAFAVQQEGRLIRVSALMAKAYSGAISGHTLIDLSSGTAHDSVFLVDGVNLERLASASRLKKSPLSGLLRMEGRLKGKFADPAGMSGEAKVLVVKGRMFGFPLFGRLGDILFGRKNNAIVFSGVSGVVRMKDGAVSTRNLTLRGDQLVVGVRGAAVFGGKLDLMVDSRFNERVLIPSLNVVKYALRVTGSLGFLVSVHIGGTWAKPQYFVLPRPASWVERVENLMKRR